MTMKYYNANYNIKSGIELYKSGVHIKLYFVKKFHAVVCNSLNIFVLSSSQ